MDAIIDTLKKAGKLFYPKTKTKAVYDDNNNRLDNTLTGITDSLNAIKFMPNYSRATALSNDITTYTASENGFILSGLYVNSSTSYYTAIRINGFTVSSVSGGHGLDQNRNYVMLPISKNDVVTWIYENSTASHSNYNYFIPMK